MPRHNKHNPSPPSAKRNKGKRKRGPEDATRNALVRRKLLLGVSPGDDLTADDLPSATTVPGV